MIFAKLALSIAIGVGWFFLGGESGVAVVLGVFVFFVLIFNAKRTKISEEDEHLKERIAQAQERKIAIEERRILEKKDAENKKKAKET